MDDSYVPDRHYQPHSYRQPPQTNRIPKTQNTFPAPASSEWSSPRSHPQRQAHGHVSPKNYPSRQQYSTADLLPQPRPYQHIPTTQRNTHGVLQAPQPTFRPSNRHLSHISALSTSEPAIDSRPISEIDSQHAVGQATEHPPSEAETYISSQNSRHASPGRKSGRKVPRSNRTSPGKPLKGGAVTPTADSTATMQALTHAIRQGIGPNAASSNSTTPKHMHEQKLRMPFQEDEPSSPSSIYTDATNPKHGSVPLSSYQGYDVYDSRHSTISEKDGDELGKDDEKSDSMRDLPTPMSHASRQPLVDGDKPGMSSRIPLEKRPPKLNISAVREAEARGSMTSLSDLIKRATKLASNLDRGRTASRLGHLDMFGSSEKLPNTRVRDSTYSDIMAAFPPPADGAGTPGGNRPTTMWPDANRQFMASKSTLGLHGDGNGKPRRQCCGLSPPIFAMILILVVLLVAAAVLVPVFLLVIIPKQHKSVNLHDCTSSHSCQNGGVSVVLSDTCACVCVDGFTGSTCSIANAPECATASLMDGSNTYTNATVGTSVLPILQQTQKLFGLPLDLTTILSTFASNNLSCASENSLVEFGSSATRSRRFVIVPSLQENRPSVALARRQDATQSANGIVFATSSATSTAPAVSAFTASASSTTLASATSSSIGPIKTSSATEQQREFAAAVVLFVLQSNEVSVAVGASQAIGAYFDSSTTGNATVEVVGGSQRIDANFDKLEITFANGTSIGGSS